MIWLLTRDVLFYVAAGAVTITALLVAAAHRTR